MLQNIPKDKILEIVRQGPTFPHKISKQLGGGADTMLIGAILSTLISTGEVRVSTLKIGGSPLYYVPSQESKLEEYEDHLNEKDRKTLRILKEKKVLQDELQDPLTRVSLRALKDFAKAFEVLIDGKKILFWRFYLISHDDAEPMAKSMFKKPESEKDISESNHKPVISEEIKHQTIPQSDSTNTPKETHSVEPVSHETTKPQHAEVQAVLEDKKEHTSEREKEHEHHPKPEHHAAKHHENHAHHDKAKTEHHTQPKAHKLKVPQIDFYEIIKNHVASIGLDILSKEKIKKTEYDMILKNHETNEYIYCKAKDKSIISEGDLAPALIYAQSKKMPCLFLSTGELTKKAELMIVNELKEVRYERIKTAANEA